MAENWPFGPLANFSGREMLEIFQGCGCLSENKTIGLEGGRSWKAKSLLRQVRENRTGAAGKGRVK